jgi:SAM-dependent methyltransferase
MLTDSLNIVTETNAPYSRDILHSTEPNSRGVKGYAETLGYTTEELISKIAGLDIIDLGTARGRFATELEYARVCKSVRSLNKNFKDPNYDYQWGNSTFKVDTTINNANTVEVLSNEPLLAVANHAALTNRLALDWTSIVDMQTIPSASADVFVSSFGFPYYSDFDDAIYGYDKFHKYSSLVTFSELARILRPNGKMYLHASNSTNWNRPSSVKFEEDHISEVLSTCNLNLSSIHQTKLRNMSDIILVISK